MIQHLRTINSEKDNIYFLKLTSIFSTLLEPFLQRIPIHINTHYFSFSLYELITLYITVMTQSDR